MGAVVDEKILVLEAGAEVAPQQGEHSVFRLDLRGQHSAVVGEADEAPEKMGLAVQVPDGLKDRTQCFIGEVMEEGGTFLQQFTDKAVECHLPRREAGEKASAYQLQSPGGEGMELAQDPLGMGVIRFHPAGGKEGRRLIAVDGDGALVLCVALKNAAEKALKAAIIEVQDFLHGNAPSGG